MARGAREWLEVVITLPDGPSVFQRELVAAEAAEALEAGRAISLAYAALTIIDTGHAGSFEPWYRERAMSLLRHAADVFEATNERQSAGAMN
ncbi:hypothetical protein CO731_01262 [Aminobacter sp. MSH1]|nr:hypothetical protein CO731_01262 [Aminobacter sp. MSH1]